MISGDRVCACEKDVKTRNAATKRASIYGRNLSGLQRRQRPRQICEFCVLLYATEARSVANGEVCVPLSPAEGLWSGVPQGTKAERRCFTHLPQLSFAKTASAAMSLRCNAFVTVMKTAELRDCDNSADTRDPPRERTLLVETQMGSGRMVVTEIRGQGSLQMPRVQDDEMVQAFSSFRADQAFGVGVLPGTPGRGEYLFNAH